MSIITKVVKRMPPKHTFKNNQFSLQLSQLQQNGRDPGITWDLFLFTTFMIIIIIEFGK